MTAIQRTAISQKITEDLERLENEIKELNTFLQPVEVCCSLGELARNEMLYEQTVYQKSLDLATIRVTKLRLTLNRVHSEDFGICSECEEDILYERLLLLPESTQCVACLNEN